MFEENRRQRNENIAGLLAGWSENDRLTLRELLGRFVTDLENFDKTRFAASTAGARGTSEPSAADSGAVPVRI